MFVLWLGVLTFSLVETKGCPLPERIEDMPGVLGVRDWCSGGEQRGENAPLLNDSMKSNKLRDGSNKKLSRSLKTF